MEWDGETEGNLETEGHAPTGNRRPSVSQTSAANGGTFLHQRTSVSSVASQHLPLPVTTRGQPVSRKPNFFSGRSLDGAHHRDAGKVILPKEDEGLLLPASMPPKYHIFDLFPLSLLIKFFTKRGKELKGKKAARLRAKMRDRTISHNLPLEISLYLVSCRSTCDVVKLTAYP